MNTSSLRSNAMAPVPSPTPIATGTPTAADKVADKNAIPHPFAELLRQSRGEGSRVAKPAAAPAPQPGSPLQSDEAGEAGEATPEAGDATTPIKAGPATKQRVRAAPTSKEPAAESAEPNAAEATKSGRDVATAAIPGDDTMNAAAAAALASRADAAARAVAADLGPATGARNLSGPDTGETTAALATGDGRLGATEAKRGRVDADSLRAGRDVASGDESTAAALPPTFLATLAESGQAHEQLSSLAGQQPGGDALTAALIAGAAPTPGEPARIDATPAQVAMTTPTDSPEFASALGVQVSLLAHDGVQQAELHLNPAETGPVSIRISLDGNEARVDFGADLAATREAIERGLPELAAALSDAGFTLAGGGVSQHASERRSSEDGAPTRGARHLAEMASSAAATSTARVTRRVGTGGVDLYA